MEKISPLCNRASTMSKIIPELIKRMVTSHSAVNSLSTNRYWETTPEAPQRIVPKVMSRRPFVFKLKPPCKLIKKAAEKFLSPLLIDLFFLIASFDFSFLLAFLFTFCVIYAPVFHLMFEC